MKNMFRNHKLILVILVLILINIIGYRWNYKIAKKNFKQTYSVVNFIDLLKTFKPFLDCKEKIYVYINLPSDVDSLLFPVRKLTNYAISPCETEFKGKETIERKSGFFIVNRLHKEFDYYKNNSEIVKKADEILLFKLDTK
jgi:hypothetical protein